MTGILKVTGKTTVGSTLTASQGTFNDAHGVSNLQYIWERTTTDTNGVLQTNQIGVGSTYKLTAADIGNNVSVRAEYMTIATSGQPSTAGYTDALSVLNHVHTGSVSIKGDVTVGSTLSAVSTIKDKDGLGTFDYTWIATDSDGHQRVLNSSTSTYKLTSVDVDDKISVTVNYLDKASHLEEATSKSSAAVSISTKTSAADDMLSSTAGLDKLTGGLGSDTFNFGNINVSHGTSLTRDIITDFNHSQGDKIDLSSLDAFTSTSSDDAFQWLGNVAPTGDQTTGVVWFDANTSTLYASNDADADAEFAIQLTGVTVLETTGPNADIKF